MAFPSEVWVSTGLVPPGHVLRQSMRHAAGMLLAVRYPSSNHGTCLKDIDKMSLFMCLQAVYWYNTGIVSLAVRKKYRNIFFKYPL